MARLSRTVLLSIFVLFFVACGGGGGSSSTGAGVGGNLGPGPGPESTGTLVLKQTLAAREVPSGVDQVRISGASLVVPDGVEDMELLDPNGPIEWTYGPLVFPKAPQYILEDVPVSVQTILLEYLQEGSVRGYYLQRNVVIDPDEPFEIADPEFTDLAGVFTRLEISHSNLDPRDDPNRAIYLRTNDSPGGQGLLKVLGFSQFGVEGFDITWLAHLESSNPSALEVFNLGDELPLTGNFLAKSDGTVTVTARFIDLEASRQVVVGTAPEPVLEEIIFLENGAVLTGGTSVQLSAAGRFSDGSQRNITSECEWSLLAVSPSDPFDSTLSLSTPGLLTVGGPYEQFYVRIFHPVQLKTRIGYLQVETPGIEGESDL